MLGLMRKRVMKLFILLHHLWSMTWRVCPRKETRGRKEKVERRQRRVEKHGRKQKRLILQMKRLKIVIAPQTLIVTDEDHSSSFSVGGSEHGG